MSLTLNILYILNILQTFSKLAILLVMMAFFMDRCINTFVCILKTLQIIDIDIGIDIRKKRSKDFYLL